MTPLEVVAALGEISKFRLELSLKLNETKMLFLYENIFRFMSELTKNNNNKNNPKATAGIENERMNECTRSLQLATMCPARSSLAVCLYDQMTLLAIINSNSKNKKAKIWLLAAFWIWLLVVHGISSHIVSELQPGSLLLFFSSGENRDWH